MQYVTYTGYTPGLEVWLNVKAAQGYTFLSMAYHNDQVVVIMEKLI